MNIRNKKVTGQKLMHNDNNNNNNNRFDFFTIFFKELLEK